MTVHYLKEPALPEEIRLVELKKENDWFELRFDIQPNLSLFDFFQFINEHKNFPRVWNFESSVSNELKIFLNENALQDLFTFFQTGEHPRLNLWFNSFFYSRPTGSYLELVFHILDTTSITNSYEIYSNQHSFTEPLHAILGGPFTQSKLDLFYSEFFGFDEVKKIQVQQFRSYYFRHNFSEIIEIFKNFLSSDYSLTNQNFQNDFSEEELELLQEMLFYIRKPKDLSDKVLSINTFDFSGDDDKQLNLNNEEEQLKRNYLPGKFEMNFDHDIHIISHENKQGNTEFSSERTMEDSIRIFMEKFALPEENTFLVFPVQIFELVPVLINENEKITNYFIEFIKDKTTPFMFGIQLGLPEGIFIFPTHYYSDLDMSNQFSKLIISFLLPLDIVQDEESKNQKNKNIVLYITITLHEFLFFNISEHRRLKDMTNHDMKYFLNLTENFKIENEKRKLYFTIIAEPKGIEDPDRLFPKLDGLKNVDDDEGDEDDE
jgi:hypothetical protein